MAKQKKPYPSADERLGLAQEDVNRAWALANTITAETPGRQRSTLIHQVHAQVRSIKCWTRTITGSWRCSPTPEQLASAKSLESQGYAALDHAHRFTRGYR